MTNLLSGIGNIHPILLKNTLEYLMPSSYCKCTFKNDNFFKIRYVNKELYKFFNENYKKLSIKKCIVLKPNINYNKRLDGVTCDKHNLNEDDVGQLEIFFRNQIRLQDTIYNSESIMSASSIIDTSNFLHSSNTDNLKQFIRTYYSGIIEIREDCCSGKGFKIVLI